MNSFLEIASLSFLFDFLSVSMKTAGSFFEIELGSVNFLVSLPLVQKVLRPVHIDSRSSLVVLHNAIRSEEVVDHVRRKGDSNECAEGQRNIGVNLSVHANTLVGNVDGLLEALHVFLRR